MPTRWNADRTELTEDDVLPVSFILCTTQPAQSDAPGRGGVLTRRPWVSFAPTSSAMPQSVGYRPNQRIIEMSRKRLTSQRAGHTDRYPYPVARRSPGSPFCSRPNLVDPTMSVSLMRSYSLQILASQCRT